ncbi:MAG: sporulation integral membrane protein YtvI [Candidatus Desulforudis sp.]|nr:sporulation integral membrane protein YtvI [Desulforudis sp.]
MVPSESVRRLTWTAGALLLVTLNLIVLGYAAGYLLPILFPFLVALVLSLLIDPVVSFLQTRLRFPRPLAVIGVILVILGAVGYLLTIAVLRLLAELVQLSSLLPYHIANFRRTFEGLIEEAVAVYGKLPPGAVSYLDDLLVSLVKSLEGFLRTAIDTAFGLLSIVPIMIIIIMVTFVATYFISRDWEKLSEAWVRLIPAPWGASSLHVLNQGFGAFIRFLRAQLVLISITMAITITGLSLIGSPYAVTIGIITGIFDLLPILGPTTIFVPWIIWCVLTGSYSLALKLSILYAVLFVIRASLEAKVISMNMGLHPLAVLAAMYIGLKVMGILGVVLGPILLIIVQGGIKAGIEARGVNSLP